MLGLGNASMASSILLTSNKINATGSQTTTDVFPFNYIEITSGDFIYHCTSEATVNAKANEDKWQIVRKDTVTNIGSMANVIVNGECVPDFAYKINSVTGLTGADTYLNALTYWTP